MKWIDIEKQQPEDGQKVLITNGQMITAATADIETFRKKHLIWWDSCHWSGFEWMWDFDDMKITHWMPLPELPAKQSLEP